MTDIGINVKLSGAQLTGRLPFCNLSDIGMSIPGMVYSEVDPELGPEGLRKFAGSDSHRIRHPTGYRPGRVAHWGVSTTGKYGGHAREFEVFRY